MPRRMLHVRDMQPHEKLEIYWVAEEFSAFCRQLLPRIRRYSRSDADQLDGCSGTIPNNIAEAADESSPGDKVRFFRYALRENGEAFAIITRQRGKGVSEDEWRIAKHYTDRIGGTLNKLVQKWSDPQTRPQKPGTKRPQRPIKRSNDKGPNDNTIKR